MNSPQLMVPSLPFILNFVKPIDARLHNRVIREGRSLGESYDPRTQTSAVSILEGTTLTYVETGIFGGDTRVDDT